MAGSKLVTDPSDSIRAIFIKYLDHRIGPAGADCQIIAILTRRGLATKKRLHPMKVGFHRKNRGGVIGASQEVEILMEDIAMLCWNFTKTAHAVAVEVATGDTSDEDAFREWCEVAETGVPPVLPARGCLACLWAYQCRPTGDYLQMSLKRPSPWRRRALRHRCHP